MGKGIHESLTRTCSDQLNHLAGNCSPDHAEPWVRELSEKLSCHNDRCESPFAFAKRLLLLYPNLRTWRAGAKACSKMNNFFRLPDQKRSSQYNTQPKTRKETELGPAWTLQAPLLAALQAWGKASSDHMAAWDKEDTVAAIAHEAQRTQQAQKERQTVVLAKKVRTNKAAEVELAETRDLLVDHLKALPTGSAKERYLKDQHRGHMMQAAVRNHKFAFNTKMSAEANGVAASVAHLAALVGLMIDAAPEVLDLAVEEDSAGFRRKLPTLSAGLRSILVDKAEAEDVAEAAELALQDDPELLQLRLKYANKKFKAVSWAGKGKKRMKVEESYEIVDILWDSEHGEEGGGVWVAACVELGDNGEIPAESKTPLGVVFQKSIVYYDFPRWTPTLSAGGHYERT